MCCCLVPTSTGYQLRIANDLASLTHSEASFHIPRMMHSPPMFAAGFGDKVSHVFEATLLVFSFVAYFMHKILQQISDQKIRA